MAARDAYYPTHEVIMNLGQPALAVVPALDAHVLMTFAQVDDGLGVTAVHALVGSASRSGIELVLDRLTQQGLLHRNTHGRRHIYSANRRHVAWSAVDQLATMRSRVVGQLRSSVKAWITQPESILIHGALATSRGDDSSTVDIIAVGVDDTEIRSLQWLRQCRELEELGWLLTGNQTIVQTATLREVRAWNGHRRNFVKILLADSIALFGWTAVELFDS